MNNSYKSFPPSVSTMPAYSAEIPMFGSQLVHTVIDGVVSVFRGVFVGSSGVVVATCSFLMAIIAKITGLFGAAPLVWQARSSSTAEYSMGPSAVPTGAGFVI